MNIDLNKLSNVDLVQYVSNRIDSYEQSKVMTGQAYNTINMREIQQLEGYLQRCVAVGTVGANETAMRVKTILALTIPQGTDYASKNIDMFSVYQNMANRMFNV